MAGAGLLLAALAPLSLDSATASEGARPAASPAAARPPQRPKRVVFIVLDQLRPEFIDAFDMENVKALMAGGANFPNAYLGHMGRRPWSATT